MNVKDLLNDREQMKCAIRDSNLSNLQKNYILTLINNDLEADLQYLAYAEDNAEAALALESFTKQD